MSTVNLNDPVSINKEEAILMLPLKIETRFMRIANDQEPPLQTGNSNTVSTPSGDHELWIRAYPDAIAVHSHDPRLKEKEANEGSVFWKAIWNSKGDKSIELAAWKSLVKKYGPQRSAWIVKTMTPENLDDRPTGGNGSTPIDDGDVSLSGLSKTELEAGEKYWETLDKTKGDSVKGEAALTELQSKVTKERASEIAFESLKLEKTEPSINEKTSVTEASSSKEEIASKSTEDARIDVNKSLSKKESLTVSNAKKTMVSLDSKDQLTKSVSGNLSEGSSPQFPSMSFADKNEKKATESRVMPQKLLFAVYRRGGLDPYLKYGNLIPDPLPVGLDPADQSAFSWDANGNLIIAGNMKWMTDFEEAVRVGMAVKISVTSDEANPSNIDAGFERVAVVGVRDQETPEASKDTLEGIFENHQYTGQGLSLLPQGTPTNNTGSDNTAYNAGILTAEESYQAAFGDVETAATSAALQSKETLKKTDGDYLAELLKIDPSKVRRAAGADEQEITDAHAMNQALWSGTMGSYLEDMFYSNDPTFRNIFTQETIDQVRDFFLENVKGRGSFPVFRVKNQPYGILPMTNFQKGEERDLLNLGTGFVDLLQDVLVNRLWKGFLLGKEWKDQNADGSSIGFPTAFQGGGTGPIDTHKAGPWSTIMEADIHNVDDPVTGADPLEAYQNRFLNLLGLLPHSADVSFRNGVGIEASGVNFNTVFPSGMLHEDGKEFRFDAVTNRVYDFYERYYDISEYREMYLANRIENDYNNVSHTILGYPKMRRLAAGSQFSKTVYATEETAIETIVQDSPVSREDVLEEIQGGQNYLRILQGSSFEKIVTDIRNDDEPSNALLYLLARKSLVQSYWDAGTRIWEKNNLIDHLYDNQYSQFNAASANPEPLNDMAVQLGYTTPQPENLREVISILWNLCKLHEWDLKDLFEYTASNAVVSGVNPGGWQEYYVKSAFRLYCIDWEAVNYSLGIFLPVSYGSYFTQTPPNNQLQLLAGIQPKEYARGVFTRAKYKSFVKHLTPAAVFSPALKFNSAYHHSKNDLKTFFNNTTFANKLDFLEFNNTFEGKTDTRKMHEFLTDILYTPFTYLGAPVANEMKGLKATQTAIDHLSRRPTAQLEKTLMEHIDLCSYRLDAWILGLVNKRLATYRSKTAYATRIGAYGWVEDLRPGGTRNDIDGNPIQHEINGAGEVPIAIDPENQGFIHAPTADHAATAAILRSAYIQTDADIYQVNISSQRAKKAQSFIEGIRGGIPLPELLGYEFERALHDMDAGLNVYIQALRQAFPIVANQLETGADNNHANVEKLAARKVLNGLALLEARRTGIENGNVNYPYGISALPTLSESSTTIIDQMNRGILKIEDILDGLADVTLAEAVYQAASGNFARSGAMAKALNSGGQIPEPEVIKPRSNHQVVSLRAGVVFSPIGITTSSPWINISITAKALAEPALNAWLSEQFGTPSDVEVYYTYKHLNGSGELEDFEDAVQLTALGLHAIDLLPVLSEMLRGGASEIHHRIEMHILSNTVHQGVQNLKVDISRKGPLAGPNQKTLMEWVPLAKELMMVVGESKALRARDLEVPSFIPASTTTGLGEDLVEIQQRVQAIGVQLQSSIDQVDGALQQTIFNHALLRTHLVKMTQFSLPEALPFNAIGNTESDEILLRKIAELSLKLASDKMTQYAQEMAMIESGVTSTEETLDALDKAVKAIFGSAFFVLPQFKAYNGKGVELATANSANILPSDPLAMDKWLHTIGCVRSKMGALENVTLIQELEENDLIFTPIQLPHRVTDQWMGLEYDPEVVNTKEEKIALYFSLPYNFEPRTNVYCGLLIDDWTEHVAVDEENTAIAFHYDQPNAKAPQSILLGVHSEGGTGSWDYNELLSIVASTAELTRLRAVEPDQLMNAENGAISMLLPGIMDKITDQYSDISMDFSRNITTDTV